MTTINQKLISQPRPNVKQINYSAKTFGDFKQNFIDFARAYFPNTYADFNEASPGMMFIEMASYLGDVLSFYIDNQFKENLLGFAEQEQNIITIAQFLGYKPKLTSAASVKARLYQIAPAVLDSSVSPPRYIPDPKYLLKIGKGSTFSTTERVSTTFRTTEDVDFSNITEEDYNLNRQNAGTPLDYIVYKDVNMIAAEEKITTFTFNSPIKFSAITMPAENIIGITSVVDSDGNNWYEVDYLAQDAIMSEAEIVSNGESGILPPSRLRLKKVPRRFVTRRNRNLQMQLIFGSGLGTNYVEDTIDSQQIANTQYGNIIQTAVGDASINNLNFLNSDAFGLAPANTTLTVKYLVGGGVASNTPAESLVNIVDVIVNNNTTLYNSAERTTFNTALRSLAVTNPLPATGGGDGESLEEIRQNALGFFNAQSRVVTAEDYVIRSYSLPTKYGSIAKAFAVRDEQLNAILAESSPEFVTNPIRPNSVNLYTLGYDVYGKLTTLNTIVKQNLARYLEQYRMLTDDINILDAFIINIGVRFDITVYRGYNMNDVLARSIATIQNFFDIKKWNINQPIIVSDLIYEVGNVDGVQSVRSLEIFNKYQFKDGSSYQPYKYDISAATVDNVIYPSLDPSIFELKNPVSDIIGNATQ